MRYDDFTTQRTVLVTAQTWAPAHTFVGEVPLGSRTGSIFAAHGNSGAGVQWRVGALTYELYFMARVGSEEEIRAVIAEFVWP